VAVYTINCSTNHGYLRSTGGSYNSVRGGNSLTATASAQHYAGQHNLSGTFYLYEAFLDFDTSTVVGTISSVVLKVYGYSLATDNSYTLEARLYPFGTSLTTADWVPGSDMSGDTLLASLASGSFSVGAYNSFTDVAFVANINQAGRTRFYIATDRMRTATSPASNKQETAGWDSATGTNPPQLVITTADSTNGEVVKTIAAFTLSSTATRKTNGALSQDVGTFGLSAQGAVGGAGEGVLNQSIGTLSLSGTIVRKTNAYFDNSFGDFGLGATTAVAIEGVLSASIGTVGLNAYSLPGIDGVLSQSIGAFELDATSTGANQGVLSASIGSFLLVAVESGPAWPSIYDFPQSPLDGTWRRERGDDTLRTDRAVGARQYRTQNGGNYADVTFAIMLKSNLAKDLLDRFFRDDCKNGATPFYWIDPETGDNMAWLWAAPPQIRHVARETYRVDCALLKEAA
jgi:hypothetical protein